jgi:hypothetical protein
MSTFVCVAWLRPQSMTARIVSPVAPPDREGTTRTFTDCRVLVPTRAWIHVSSSAVMSRVSTVNVPVVDPDAIVIDDGTRTSGLRSLSRLTMVAPRVFTALSVTVAVVELPPVIRVSATVSDLTVMSGVIRTSAVKEELPAETVIRTRTSDETARVVIGNVAVVAPWAAVTVDETDAAASSAATARVSPPRRRRIVQGNGAARRFAADEYRGINRHGSQQARVRRGPPEFREVGRL